jgi:GT2 family glycosyltransferase
LVHELNQRYRREFDRAERLRAELIDIHRSRLWPLFRALRQLARWTRQWPPRRNPNGDEVAPPTTNAQLSISDTGQVATGRVSIIIPFRNRAALLSTCLRSLRRTTTVDHEFILVDNGSTDRRTRRLRRRWAAAGGAVVDCAGPFNFSSLCNAGARRASGDWLLFLNNDTEALAPDWLIGLLKAARMPGVGVVGATLLYPDGTIQHAGMAPQADGTWTHPHRGHPAGAGGPNGELAQVRSVPAVTGACLLIGRRLFWDVGGFDERLPLTMNDVDLCARVRARGLTVVVTPHARLLHYESLSRGYARGQGA